MLTLYVNDFGENVISLFVNKAFLQIKKKLIEKSVVKFIN